MTTSNPAASEPLTTPTIVGSQSEWQPLRVGDLPDVIRIAAQLHPGLPERAEVLAEKIRLAPGTCCKLIRAGRCAGYGIAHPWQLEAIPPLDAFFEKIPEPAECLYVHDIAILPAARGSGAAAAYLARLKQIARASALRALALTSVYGTSTLWSRFGFVAQSSPALTEKLHSYGSSAVYMMCREPWPET